LLDGESQSSPDAQVEGFEEKSGWGWVRGRTGPLTRTVVSGEHYLLDVLELAGRDDRLVELPWHFTGPSEVPGTTWQPGEIADEFVTRVEGLHHGGDHPVRVDLTADSRQLTAHFVFQGELLRAEAPGRPAGPRQTFYLARARGRNLRIVTAVEFGTPGLAV